MRSSNSNILRNLGQLRAAVNPLSHSLRDAGLAKDAMVIQARVMVRIGLLGAGAMGAAHAAAYAGMADVEVVGVLARSDERARPVASLCGAEPFTDPAALMERVDAVDVCLPTPLHRAMVVPALQRGKHVLCETPLALAMEDALAMRDAARSAGRLLQVGLLMRSVGAYAHLEKIARSGGHGRLLALSTWRLGSYLRPDAPDHKRHYGDPATELMTFDFDVANWLMGPPARLSAAGGGDVTALLGYGDGRHATIRASGLMPPGFPFTVGFRALFERAVFTLETIFSGGMPSSTFTICEGAGPPRPFEMVQHDPYEVELRRFIDCIVGGADPALLDVDRAIEALDLSLATRRALTAGRTIRL
jgi:predicted dehydrogenase